MRRLLRLLPYLLAALALIVVALNWTYGRLPAEPTPHSPFVTVDGLRIHYLERPGDTCLPISSVRSPEHPTGRSRQWRT